MAAMQRHTQRNQRMDLYRGLAIYAVILIHILLPGRAGIAVRVLARFAVPLFFLTAGYFSWAASPAALAKRAARTFRLLAMACIPYVVLGCILAVQKGKNPLAGLAPLLNLTAWRNFLLYQIIPFPYAWQLWFLGALASVYLLWWLLTLFYRNRGLFLPYDRLGLAAVVLLALHLIVGEGSVLLHREVPPGVLRSIPFDALPFFALGCWTAYRRQDIRACSFPFYLLLPIGALLSLLEGWLVGAQELYLGTLVLLAGLMGRAVQYRRVGGSPLTRALVFCGQELTLPIYIVHMLILSLLRECPIFPPLISSGWLTPILVAVLSTLLALLWVHRNTLFHGRRPRGRRIAPPSAGRR